MEEEYSGYFLVLQTLTTTTGTKYIAMSVWRKVGLTYNGYISIAAGTLRSALKNELKTAAVFNRAKTEARFTVYENGEAKCEPTPLVQ